MLFNFKALPLPHFVGYSILPTVDDLVKAIQEGNQINFVASMITKTTVNTVLSIGDINNPYGCKTMNWSMGHPDFKFNESDLGGRIRRYFKITKKQTQADYVQYLNDSLSAFLVEQGFQLDDMNPNVNLHTNFIQ